MAETIVKIGALAASFCELDPDSVRIIITTIICMAAVDTFNTVLLIQFFFCFLATYSRRRDLPPGHAAPRKRSVRA